MKSNRVIFAEATDMLEAALEKCGGGTVKGSWTQTVYQFLHTFAPNGIRIVHESQLNVTSPAALQPEPQGVVLEPKDKFRAGYTMLDEGDTFQDGDEVFLPSEGWVPTIFVGEAMLTGDVGFYRRKEPKATPAETCSCPECGGPEIGKGYRRLVEGEIHPPTSESWCLVLGRWIPTAFVGAPYDGSGTYRCSSDDAGEGYRRLVKGETIQDGDEYRAPEIGNHEWKPTHDAGNVFDGGYPDMMEYRRKVETPQPELVEFEEIRYRILSEDELVQEGDEYQASDKYWRPLAEHSALDRAGEPAGDVFPWRRKVEPQPELVEFEEIRYRILSPDEVVEEGDEYQQIGSGKWLPLSEHRSASIRVGKSVSDVFPWRRKVQPAYRFLEAGEYVLPGDEAATFEGWRPVVARDHDGAPVSIASAEQQRYRRKIGAPGPAGNHYRFLTDPEQLLETGDETFTTSEDGSWETIPSYYAGLPVGEQGAVSRLYRRKL